MYESEQHLGMRFDWLGFAALATGIGAMQVMLDRGEQLGWFSSPEIVTEAIVAAGGLYFFLAHSLTTATPFVRFEIFKDRNYVGGILFMVVIGVVLFGTMALVSPYLQSVLNYPILTAGWMLAGRGVGTLISMLMVGRLMQLIEARYLILVGLLLTAVTLEQMSGFTDQTAASTIIWASVVQGSGIGLVFVPLSTVAFTTLPGHLRTDGTAILTLVRNIGSSIGISAMIANLTNSTIVMHADLTQYVTPFNNALQMPNAAMLDLKTDTGRALIDQIITQQATVVAYANDFRLLMWLTIAVIPLVFVIGSARTARPAAAAAPAPAFD
jgi:DHA2 family multidrug resistance protein